MAPLSRTLNNAGDAALNHGFRFSGNDDYN